MSGRDASGFDALDTDALEPAALEPAALEPDASDADAPDTDALDTDALEPAALEPDAADPIASDRSTDAREDLGSAPDDAGAIDEPWLDPFGLVGTAAGDPSELRDIAAHHHRLSWLGRVDLTLVWRRRWRPVTADAVAMASVEPLELSHRDTVLVLATWRK